MKDTDAIDTLTVAMLQARPEWSELYNESPSFRVGLQSIAYMALLAAEAQAWRSPGIDTSMDLVRRAAQEANWGVPSGPEVPGPERGEQ